MNKISDKEKVETFRNYALNMPGESLSFGDKGEIEFIYSEPQEYKLFNPGLNILVSRNFTDISSYSITKDDETISVQGSEELMDSLLFDLLLEMYNKLDEYNLKDSCIKTEFGLMERKDFGSFKKDLSQIDFFIESNSEKLLNLSIKIYGSPIYIARTFTNICLLYKRVAIETGRNKLDELLESESFDSKVKLKARPKNDKKED